MQNLVQTSSAIWHINWNKLKQKFPPTQQTHTQSLDLNAFNNVSKTQQLHQNYNGENTI